MNTKKTLIILRHGQAKNSGINEYDHDRELTLRGRKEAIEAGETLFRNGFIPDYVICSTAVRARETLGELQNLFTEQFDVEYLSKIYNASETELLVHIAAIPDKVGSLLLVGHNPALYQLSLALAKDGDKRMRDNLQMHFPTCALVVINFEGTWRNIMDYCGKLVLFSIPEI